MEEETKEILSPVVSSDLVEKPAVEKVISNHYFLKLVFAFLILFVVGVGLFYFILYKKNGKVSNDLAKQVTIDFVPSVDQTLVSLHSVSKLKLPAITQSKEILKSELPIEFSELIPAVTESLVFYKTTYLGGKTGYSISGQASDSLANFFQKYQLPKNLNLTKIFSGIANKGGVLDEESAKILLRVDSIKTNEQAVEFNIYIVLK